VYSIICQVTLGVEQFGWIGFDEEVSQRWLGLGDSVQIPAGRRVVVSIVALNVVQVGDHSVEVGDSCLETDTIAKTHGRHFFRYGCHRAQCTRADPRSQSVSSACRWQSVSV
jgi:hypothetical protein